MANLIINVDKTTGNYRDHFNYSINASFNGIEGDINSAKIDFFVPNFINLSSISNVEITETDMSDGKNITFDFGEITNLGVAFQFSFGASFLIGTPVNANYQLIGKMIINNQEQLSSSADLITLSASADFQMTRQIVLPKADPARNGEIYIKTTVQNFGDLGVPLNDIAINIMESEFLIIDKSYEILGYDTSTSSFADTSSDGIVGSVENNAINFTIPNYFGEKYEFIYKAIIDGDATDFFTNNTDFLSQNVLINTDILNITLSEPIFETKNSMFSPSFALQNENISTEITFENIGNQALTNAIITKTLSPDINYTNIKTGTFFQINIAISEQYFIEYASLNGIIGSLGPFNTSTNSSVSLQNLLSEDDKFESLTWVLPNFYVGMKTKNSPHINGIIRESANQTISENLSIITNETAKSTLSKDILIEDTCVLQTKFRKITNITNAKPNDIIKYQIGANCRRSRLSDPIIGFILPKELEFAGNIVANYSDYFGNTDPVITPEPNIIKDINSNGDSAIIFEFSHDFSQKSVITIEFDTKVKVGATGTINASMILNTLSSNASYLNNNKFINYSINESISQYAWSGNIQTQIILIAMYRVDKKVKGMLDDDYIEEPLVASTLDGGEITYKLTIENIGNVDFYAVELVDILPHIGDTGIITTKSSRNSQFNVYAISQIIANSQSEIYYSHSYDPVRFGSSFDIIGTDNDWNTQVPEDLSLVKSFKIQSNNISLAPNSKLEYLIKMLCPVGVPTEYIAWNTIAVSMSYKDDNNKFIPMLATEPEKVGVKIVTTPENTGQITGKVWFKSTDNGINDVGVVLMSQDNNIVGITFTNTDFLGNNGIFKFSNLEFGRYYLKYFISNDFDFIDGKSTSGIIDLSQNLNFNNIEKGLIPKDKINEILEVNNSARRMFRNVIFSQILLTMKNEDVHELFNL